MATLRRLWARPLSAAVLVSLLPFLVLAARALVDDADAPSGDVALIEVRVSDVGRWTPLLGSYQRYGFNHPGPLLFYALAGPYRLLGSRYAGIEVGALLLGGLSLVVILRVAFRRGGRLGLLWAAALVAVAVRAVGPAWLLDAWEPHVLALVAAAVIALASDAVGGRASALPFVAAAASFVAEAWATMLPLALAMGGWSTVGLIVHAGRSVEQRRAVARSLVVGAGVVAVLWLPPVMEQLSHDHGNLSSMIDALREPPAPALGLADGWRVVATELGHRPSWVGFPQALDGLSPTLDLDTAPVPVALLALAGGLGLALRRRRDSDAWLLGTTSVLAIVAAVYALSRLLGPVFVWIPQWLRIVGMTTWCAAGWCGFAGLPDRWQRRGRIALEPFLAVVFVVIVGLATVDATRFRRQVDPLGAAVRGLVVDAARDLDDVGGPVLVTSEADADLALGGTDVATEVLVLAVEREGLETRVRPELAHQFGPQRARTTDVGAEIRLVRADEAARAPVGFETVAEVDPLTARQRATREAMLATAGLPGDASDADYVRSVLVHPDLRADAARLRAVPDLPRLRLLLRVESREHR
ncbi:MAG TPA: hypothetical protein VM143_07145 [Acidimicrobiales bacterium]|nr:hypothetical protein [Acidimicrobiales bacterium]